MISLYCSSVEGSKRFVRVGVESSTELWGCGVGGVLRFFPPRLPPPILGIDANGMPLQFIILICNLLLCLFNALRSERG